MDTAVFSPSALFADTSDNSSDEETNTHQNFVERTHHFPGMELIIREFSFHQLNANLLWPGTFAFAEWLVEHQSWIKGRHVIELGSGTGALAIFLKKLLQIDITTSDYNDQEIEDNISYNCKINGVIPTLPHIKHTWGDAFSNVNPNWDLVIASDILLYVKQYPNLIKTLSFLLKGYQPKGNLPMAPQNEVNDGLRSPAFVMSWRRRIGKDDEALFFKGCEDAGLEVQHLGSRVYCITWHGLHRQQRSNDDFRSVENHRSTIASGTESAAAETLGARAFLRNILSQGEKTKRSSVTCGCWWLQLDEAGGDGEGRP